MTLEIPKTKKEIERLSVMNVVATQKGTIPYFRGFGVDFDIDAALPGAASAAFASAVEEISRRVPGVAVTDGRVSLGMNGEAKIHVKLGEA